MKLAWSPAAVADLRAVRQYIRQRDPHSAAQVARRILAATRKLQRFPAMGRPGRVPDTRECLVAGTPYLMPYRVRAGVIEILRVLHGAQRWPSP